MVHCIKCVNEIIAEVNHANRDLTYIELRPLQIDAILEALAEEELKEGAFQSAAILGNDILVCLEHLLPPE